MVGKMLSCIGEKHKDLIKAIDEEIYEAVSEGRTSCSYYGEMSRVVSRQLANYYKACGYRTSSARFSPEEMCLDIEWGHLLEPELLHQPDIRGDKNDINDRTPV